MSAIVLLTPEVSDKIAAGEVIERPYSVVKELVENSLDAGATDVRVELEGGGKRLIRVMDNGSGMSREDALLCFERHSTSKLRSEEDLGRISTLGFRGEALPSIAAVSRLALRTSDGMSAAGWLIDREAGRKVEARETAFPRGTSLEVRDLFFNLPARLKFLRSEQAELGLIVRWVTGIAPAFPRVAFALSHGSRKVLSWVRAENLRERLYQIYGRELMDRLMEVDWSEGQSRIEGFASRPPLGRRDKSEQHFFVNRRPVKDRTLQAALNQAYRGLLEKDLFPEAFLFLSHPYGEVDVNVHPAKSEVRFRDSQFVFRLLLRGLEQASLRSSDVKRIGLEPGSEARFRVAETGPVTPFSDPFRDAAGGASTQPAGLFAGDTASGIHSGPQVLGQYLDMYIVAADQEGLMVVDQHNAHERVLYEKYKEVSVARTMPLQQPLTPILFDLSPDRALRLEAADDLLRQAGFLVEPMGGRTYSLKQFPDIMEAREALEVFLSLLEELTDEGPEAKQDRLLATLACRTAIKAGRRLPLRQMELLVEELLRLPQHALCPHGRPIIVRLDRSQIEKGLKRK
jgi:DNA mismatch repair protein MutL